MSTIITPAPAHQRPSGKMFLDTDQLNLVNGASTLVELDIIPAGFVDGIEDAVNHRITPGQAGFYIILGMVRFLNIVAGHNYQTFVRISGGVAYCHNVGYAGGGTELSLPFQDIIKLTATDYVELYARSYSGDNTVDIRAGLAGTYLSVQRVR